MLNLDSSFLFFQCLSRVPGALGVSESDLSHALSPRCLSRRTSVNAHGIRTGSAMWATRRFIFFASLEGK